MLSQLVRSSPLHLLLVDDDDVDRERVLRMLGHAGYDVHVREAASGQQAMAMALDRDHHVDCVVLDHRLTDINGAELMRRLRHEARLDCPMIMITGAGSEALAVQALKDGAADYLSKLQLSPQVLTHSIDSSLERHRLKAEVAALQRQLEQRVQDQAATIRERERDLRNILDNASSMIGYWDARLCIRFGNRAYLEWLGILPQQVPGLPMDAVPHAERLAEDGPHLRAALAGETRRIDRQVAGGPGGPTWHAQVEFRPDIGEHGRVQGVYITLTDVSPIKSAQARVEELLRFSDAVIHNSPVGISVYRADGRCVITNAVAAELLGTTVDAMLAKGLHEQALWRDSGLLGEADDTLRDGQPRRLDMSWALADGRQVHVEGLLARVDHDRQPHLLMIARDTTEAQLVHETLVAARDAAENAARTKSAFLANMSHEIRTPMNAIIGLSRVALDHPLPALPRSHIEKVHGSATALMRILDDVLDYSKIDAGQLRFEHLPMDLDELLGRVSDLFVARVEQKGLRLDIERAAGTPGQLRGDALRLSQVLNNLVGNAVKFTERGGITLAVGAAGPVEAGHCLLRFAVRDTGIGVAPHQRAALFEAFNQGDNSITRRFGGSGLGLAISKRLVGLMGGTIGFESTPGVGSEFWFTARLALADPAELAIPPSAAPGPQRQPLPQGMRVLLVEDNELNQLVARQFLQHLGVEVTLAADGAQAVQAVERAPLGHFAAVLMDLHMPVMGGLEATRRIHMLPGQAQLVVIGMTAAALPEDRTRCLEAGMVDHVSKPITPETVRNALQRWATDGTQRSPAAASQCPPIDEADTIAGFDLRELRLQLGGNEALIHRLLGMFEQRHRDACLELRELLARGEPVTARRRVHDLKGSAATICATRVHKACEALERALAQGMASEAQLDALQQALDEAMDGVAQARLTPGWQSFTLPAPLGPR